MHIRSLMRRSLRHTSTPQLVQDVPIVQHPHTIDGDNNESRDRDRAHPSTHDGSTCERLPPNPTTGLLHLRLHGLGDPCVKNNEKLHDDCVICTESFQVNEVVCQLPCCGHFFHSPCIGKWLQHHYSCPMCRKPVDVTTTDIVQQLLLLKQRSTLKNKHNLIFRDHPNFDLIMRRVLRAQEERRSKQRQDGNEDFLFESIEESLPQGYSHIDSAKGGNANNHPRRTSFSGNITSSDDWLTDDLELYVLNDEEE